jgi:hypothetical protein
MKKSELKKLIKETINQHKFVNESEGMWKKDLFNKIGTKENARTFLGSMESEDQFYDWYQKEILPLQNGSPSCRIVPLETIKRNVKTALLNHGIRENKITKKQLNEGWLLALGVIISIGLGIWNLLDGCGCDHPPCSDGGGMVLNPNDIGISDVGMTMGERKIIDNMVKEEFKKFKR